MSQVGRTRGRVRTVILGELPSELEALIARRRQLALDPLRGLGRRLSHQLGDAVHTAGSTVGILLRMNPLDGLAESCVTYDGLPISSGSAHALGRLTAREAVDSWYRFLDTCADRSPIECWYSLPATPGLTVDPAVDRMIADRFPGDHGRREVPSHRLPEALLLLESISPQPTNQWGMAPVWLWLTADFRLRSPSGEVWPGQDRSRFGRFVTPGGISLGASSTRLILQAKPAMGLAMSMPDATDADLTDMVPWLQSALPMRLSSKHWIRWTRTKRGDGYRGRRIQPVP